ncbi:ABC transporter ATP-binding protein/permease [Candidatus Trichorickettsia mobilis]|uniref:ABC transporter ATP-binding protein/permease n=1 Tax=Candidatus Trichorickettsia mobilis TaxID=1346319 RepID=A0ABZ0UVH4_9RICK|nr:ATP-binding cassette domain-containing protein [Candidatus Trichorickettsia mobilis]WPY00622.1 ABC transporter ATP-binding protein/permease [Candidatus Trichorickettsia mobilis]
MKFKAILVKLIRILWDGNVNQRIIMLLSLLLVYLSSIGIIAVPLLFKHAIDLLQQQANTNEASSPLWIMAILLAYGLCWILNQSLDSLRTFLGFRFISKALTTLLSKSLAKIIRMDFRFHINKKSGEIISVFNRMEAGLPTLMYSMLIQVIPLVIEISLAVAVVIYLFSWEYGLLLLVTLVSYLAFTIVTAKKNIEYQVEYNQKANEFTVYSLDVLQHYDTVKYFNNEDFEKDQFDLRLKGKEEATIFMYQRMGLINLIQTVIVGSGLTLITLKSGYDVLNSDMSLGGFVLLNTYLIQFSVPMSNFGYILLNLKRSFIDMQAFFDLTKDMQSTKYYPQQDLSITKPNVEFKNVTYLTDDHQKILDNISFTIPYGQTIAIIGESGAGKSTLVKLLLKFIEPAGQILIGGYNIQQIPESVLINLFGIVPQDCALFNRSIKENIVYGNLNASNAEIQDIMNKLSMQHLSNKRHVGEREAKVSGGEKQRIAIARIF